MPCGTGSLLAAMAGPGRLVDVDNRVRLKGRSSDAAATLEWARIDGPETLTLTSHSDGTVFFTPSTEGDYVLRLTATDSDSHRDKVTISVGGTNTPPTARGREKGTAVDADVTLDASGSFDDDGDALSYTWGVVSVPTGSAIDNTALGDRNSETLTFMPDETGEYELRLVVDDGTSDDTLVLRVTAYDVYDVGSQLVELGGEVMVGIDSDPSLDVRWVFDSTPSGSALTAPDYDGVCASFTPDVGGLYELKAVVSASDGSVLDREWTDVIVVEGTLEQAAIWDATQAATAVSVEDDRLVVGNWRASSWLGEVVETDLPLDTTPTWTTLLGGSATTDQYGRVVATGELDDGAAVLTNTGTEFSVFRTSSDRVEYAVDTAAFLGDLDATGADAVLLGDELYQGPLSGLATVATLECMCGAYYDTVVSVLHGPVTGTVDLSADYDAQADVTSCYGPDGVATGDVSGDGYNDLLLLDDSYYVALHTGSSGGLSSAGWIDDDLDIDLDAVTVDDVDGDGQLDLIVESHDDVAASGYVAGDWSGDGYDDFVHTKSDGLEMTLGKATGMSYFDYDLDAEGQTMSRPRVADVDGDGTDDLLVDTREDVYILYGPLSGDLEVAEAGDVLVVDGDDGLAVDTDGDGLIDLVGLDADGFWVWR
ncbi:MAG: hypothetical protein GY913_06240 [Proteobacteria bacterium]|nr:hypothetical protein [Pseudomonadota bacterium]